MSKLKPKKRTKKEQKRFNEIRAKLLKDQETNPDPLITVKSANTENGNIEREDFVAVLGLLENCTNLLTYYACSNECDAELSDITKSKNRLAKKYGIKEM